MTRRRKLLYTGLAVFFLLTAQASWVLVSYRANATLPRERLLLGVAPLVVIDVLLALVAFLLLRSSLGTKRFAFATAVFLLPLVARGVVGRIYAQRRQAELAKLQVRIHAEQARLAHAPRPVVGAAKDEDASESYRRLAAQAVALSPLQHDLEEAATAGAPLRLRLGRALAEHTAMIASLCEAAAHSRSDPAPFTHPDDRGRVDDDRVELLVQLALAEGHRRSGLGEPAAARDLYFVALRVAADLARAQHDPARGRGRRLEVRALQSLFHLATAGETSRGLDRAALANELEHFEGAILSPANDGELEGLAWLEVYLGAEREPVLWEAEDLLRAHFYFFLPPSVALLRDFPRMDRLVQLGGEWAQAPNGEARLAVEALVEEIEQKCVVPPPVEPWWRRSAEWSELALVRLVRAAAIAESRRGSDGLYPETLGVDAPEDPFAPGQRVTYSRSERRDAYVVASAGLAAPLERRATSDEVVANAWRKLNSGRMKSIGLNDWHEYGLHGPVTALAFTRDGALAVAARTVRILSLRDGGSLRATFNARTRSLAVDPNGREVLLADWKDVSRWDLATGRELQDLLVAPAVLGGFALSPDGLTMAVTVGAAGPVRLLDRDGHVRREVAFQRRGGRDALAFSPDSTLLAAGAHGRALEVLDVETGSTRFSVPATDLVSSIAFAPHGRKLIAAVGKEALIVDVAATSVTRRLETDSPLLAVAWSPRAELVATAATDGVVRLWDPGSGELLAVFRHHRGAANALAFDPSDDRLASGGVDGHVLLWDTSYRGR